MTRRAQPDGAYSDLPEAVMSMKEAEFRLSSLGVHVAEHAGPGHTAPPCRACRVALETALDEAGWRRE